MVDDTMATQETLKTNTKSTKKMCVGEVSPKPSCRPPAAPTHISNNIFMPLVEMFPNDAGEEIVKLFDDAWDYEAEADNQVKLNGLAMLLDCLENYNEDDNSSLSIPLLCKIQALQAAYHLGKNSKS